MANIKDYAAGTVLTAPSPATSGTTAVLQSGEGAMMPATPFYATAAPPNLVTNLTTAEKILVTDVTGDTLTFTRAQGDTTAKAIATGWIIANAIFTADIITDHGALTGLADDDHAQYHNDTRGDIRYYTKTANDTLLADKASITGANTYTPGQKQTVSQSATTAGLSLGNVSGNPSGAVEGDVWYNSSSDTVLYRAGASSRTVLTTDTTQTVTNKTVALGSNTVSGTTAQFNTANTDGDFATIAGSETLTNKTLTAPVIGGAMTGTHTHAITGSSGTMTLSASSDGGEYNLGVNTSGTLALFGSSGASLNVKLLDGTLSTDTIAETTSANGVTVDGLNIKDSKLNTNSSVVTNNITNAAVTADKLSTGAAAAAVATNESTTSTTYVQLTTTTDTVTVTIGANGLALVSIVALIYSSGVLGDNYASVALSGANTVAATDARAISNRNTAGISVGGTFLMTGLTPGSTTFGMRYRTSAGTGNYLNRNISVVPL